MKFYSITWQMPDGDMFTEWTSCKSRKLKAIKARLNRGERAGEIAVIYDTQTEIIDTSHTQLNMRKLIDFLNRRCDRVAT